MPMTMDDLLAFVRQHVALTESTAETLCDQAQRPDYWRSLCGDTTISLTRPHDVVDPTSRDDEITAAIANYRSYGHCHLHDAFACRDIEALRSAVTSVQRAGWPMIFAFVYDQFWTLTQAPSLHEFVHRLLGPGYQPTVQFWVNHVSPRRGSTGFPPHLDDVRPGHHSVTCWVPLSPATPDNGCVYVLERGAEGEDVGAGLAGEHMPVRQVRKAFLHVRALPAIPGSFLAWPNDTLHWGGTYLRGDARMALSYHLTSADFENIDPALRLSLVPSEPLPSFERRLRWAAIAMLRFRTRDPLLERFTPVAKLILKRYRAS